MTGRIIPLHGDLHDEAGALLPWYVTGRLDDDERARFELHLKTCAQCQAEVVTERRLQAEVAGLPEETAGHVDSGWAAMREQMGPVSPRRDRLHVIGKQWRSGPSWLRWAVAAQFALLCLSAGALTWQVAHGPQAGAQYRTLGAAPAPVAGNVVVIFRPEVSEHDLRQTLRDNHARLVDGPTVADAYILHVPAAERDATVTRLRAQAAIVLAEPVDGGDTP